MISGRKVFSLISRVCLSHWPVSAVCTMAKYNPNNAAHLKVRHLPIPTGKYPVGCVDIMTDYSPQGSFLRLYYPAEDATLEELSSKWPHWIPSQEYMDSYGKLWKPWSTIFEVVYDWFVGPVKVPAAVGAPLRKGDELYRPVVFSHGLGACRTTYSTTCTEMASRGLVVAAVEHRDGSACISYYMEKEGTGENGVKIKWIPHRLIPTTQRQYPIRNEQVNQRVSECQKALDLFQKLNDGEDIQNIYGDFLDLKVFKDRLNLTHPFIMGHSFGGATTIRACAVDKRFQSGVVMDSWMFPLKEDRDVAAEILQPLLFINMEAFQTKTNLKVMKWFEDNNKTVLTLKGTDHANQTDIPFLSENRIIKWIFHSSTKMNAYLAKDLSNALAINFLLKNAGDPKDLDLEKIIEDNRGELIDGIQLQENHL